MISGEKIVIASSSDALINYVCKRLEEIGAQNKIYRALNESALHECLKRHCPRFLFIEDSFWHSATPLEMQNLVSRYRSLRIYAFCVGDCTVNFKTRVVRVGIDGFLNMRKGRVSFRQELKEALDGKLVIPPEIEGGDFDFLPESNNDLSDRDMEVVSLICEEMENKEIGETLNIKEQSVKNRRSKIYAKANVRNTVGLLKYLFRKRIVDFNDFLTS